MGLTKKIAEFNERNNVWLKVLAVFISVLIWLVVVNVSDPVTSATFSGVPVEISNVDALTSQGKVYEMTSESTVTVTVNAKRSILDNIGKENLKAVADMRDLNENTGTIALKVESNKYNEKIESMKAKEAIARVEIDNLMKVQLPITSNVTGQPAETYVVGDIIMDQNIVRISGPEKIVSKIQKVTAEVSVEGMSSNVSTSVDLRMYTEDGGLIDTSSLTKNISSVAIVAEILATKEVSVRALTSGTPAEGYGATGKVEIEPATVVIAGKMNVLKNMLDIIIPSTELSVEGAKENVQVTLDLEDYLPDSVRFAQAGADTKVTIKAEIVEKEIEKAEVTKSQIKILNMPWGYRGSLTFEKPIEMELTGLPEAMALLKENPMEVTIDMAAYMEKKGIANLAEATYEVPLTIKLPSGVELVREKTFYVNLRVETEN